MNFFEFASKHPWLTFFLFCVVGSAAVGITRAITGHCDCEDKVEYHSDPNYDQDWWLNK